MLQELLKQATSNQHDDLEQLMFVNDIMHGTLTADQYKKLLLTNYLSHAIFEDDLLNNLSPALREELQADERAKFQALEKDLAEMQISIPKNNPDLKPIPTDDASILGAMYVLEGATLGGNVIVKRLKVNPQLEPLQLGYHYYQVYGDKLVDRWKQFVQILNTRIPQTEHGKAAQAAKDMFENIKLLSTAV